MNLYAGTETGRRSSNQDALSGDIGTKLFVVADGMGGHPNGDLASMDVITCLAEGYVPGDVGTIESSLLAADGRCRARQDHSGTTATVLALRTDDAIVVNSGDSRCYILRDGDLVQLTTDQGRGHVLSSCIGFLMQKFEQLYVRTEPGDVFILTTDGVHDTLDKQVMQDIVINATIGGGDPAKELVAQALAAGSEDNCTALVVSI